MGRRSLPKRIAAFDTRSLTLVSTWGISSPFEPLSLTSGQVTHVLLTRSPLEASITTRSPFDLHVLGTPPAFILSQDQTLRKNIPCGMKGTEKLTGYLTSLLSSYHFSVVKVQRHCFVKPIQTKAPMQLSTSARQTAIHQACVSDLRLILSCQRSVWRDEIFFVCTGE